MSTLIQRLTLCIALSLLGACATSGTPSIEPLGAGATGARTCWPSPYLQRDLSSRVRYRAADQFYIDREGRPCTF